MKPTPSGSSQDCVDGRIDASIGKPWKALGRGPWAFDCWGFVRYALGLENAPDAPYFDEESRPGKIEALKGRFTRVPDKTPYSIALLGSEGRFSHVGVYHPNGTIYHCIEGAGVCACGLRQIGILGFRSVEFYLWEGTSNDNSPCQGESLRQS